jgi:hypothetical protein
MSDERLLSTPLARHLLSGQFWFFAQYAASPLLAKYHPPRLKN